MNEDKFVSLRQLENLDDLNSELNNLNRRNFAVSRYTHSELKHMHYIPKIDFKELKTKLDEDGYIEYVLKQKSKFKNLMKKAKSLQSHMDGSVTTIFEINEKNHFSEENLNEDIKTIIELDKSNIFKQLRRIKNEKEKEYILGPSCKDIDDYRTYEEMNDNGCLEVLKDYLRAMIEYKHISFDYPLIFNSENLEEILNLIINRNEGDTLEKLYTEPKYGISHYYYSKEVKDIIKKILKKEDFSRKFDEIKNNLVRNKKEIEINFKKLFEILVSVNYELYKETRKEELEKFSISINRTVGLIFTCLKNYEQTEIKDVKDFIKFVFEFKPKNYELVEDKITKKNTKLDDTIIFMGIGSSIEVLNILIKDIFQNTLENLYQYYLDCANYLNTIVSLSKGRLYFTQIKNIKEKIKKYFDKVKGSSNEQNISTLHNFTIINEKYESYLDKYYENYKELKDIEKEIKDIGPKLLKNTDKLSQIEMDYEYYQSNALYYRQYALFYKRIVLLLFKDYHHKNASARGFSNVKKNELLKLFSKTEKRYKDLNDTSFKYKIKDLLTEYVYKENKKKDNKVNKVNKVNRMNNEINKFEKEIEEQEVKDDVVNRLKMLKENIKANNKLVMKVESEEFWKKFKNFNEGYGILIPFSNGLFDIYQCAMDGELQMKQFILTKNLSQKYFNDNIIGEQFILGMREIDNDKIKVLKKMGTAKLRRTIYDIFHSVSDYKNYATTKIDDEGDNRRLHSLLKKNDRVVIDHNMIKRILNNFISKK